MAPRSIGLDQPLQAYVTSHSSAPDEVQRRLIERTEALGSVSGMQISPEQGEFLSMLTELVGARFAVEVGTFTGYSSLAIARGLALGGRLLCCDVSHEWTSLAREHWELANVADRIDLRVAPAIETLRALPRDVVVDLAFIDADKQGYIDYYEELLERLSPTGVMCIDNTLWGGAVVDDGVNDESTVAIRMFNDHVAADDRTRQVMVPIGDGLTMVRRVR
jgi:caffeoyl-CoA O-methyltransferase